MKLGLVLLHHTEHVADTVAIFANFVVPEVSQ